MGLDFDALTEEQAVESILAGVAAGRGGWVLTPNLEHLRAFQREDDVRERFESADLVVPDGTPLLWASKVQREPLPARVAGSDLIWSLSRAAARRGVSVLLIGGNPGTAEVAARTLEEAAPGLRVVGAICPPFGFEGEDGGLEAVAAEAAALAPDIVFVGLPMGKNLALSEALRAALPSAWAIGVGISFSFVSGDVSRAPGWVQRAGLEWVHRLVQEPRRLFRRYVVEGIPFAVRLLAYALLLRALTRLTTRPDRIVPRRTA
jgi:N-acetylglucosaminyldiphosphoundecaprenol N-acetyl-beta-D-mannosaminyltransferase